MQSVENKILRRIRGKPVGWVFTPNHFLDLGSYGAVTLALKQICDRGRIDRLARGIYANSKNHPLLGTLAPTPEEIVRAIATKEHRKIQPSGAYAANLLGLSNQVPAKIVFLTDGPSKQIKVGKQIILMKNTTPKNMATAGRISGVVIQALKHLRQEYVDDRIVAQLRKNLSRDQRSELLKDIAMAPAWIGNVFRQLNEDG